MRSTVLRPILFLVYERWGKLSLHFLNWLTQGVLFHRFDGLFFGILGSFVDYKEQYSVFHNAGGQKSECGLNNKSKAQILKGCDGFKEFCLFM